MEKWAQIRKKGKHQFVLLYGLVISGCLVLDYYIIKFFLRSFKIEVTTC